MPVVIAVLVWELFAPVTYALALGFFTQHFPYMKNWRFAFGLGLLSGTVGALVMFIFSWAHGGLYWRLRPLCLEERWLIFKAKGYEILGRDYFERHHG